MTATGGSVSADIAASSIGITVSTFDGIWYLYAIISMLTILSCKVIVLIISKVVL